MHEVVIAENLMKVCLQELEKHGGREVIRVVVSASPLAGIEPEALTTSFDVLKSDTPLKNAHLFFRLTPVSALCLECGRREETLDPFEMVCSNCGSLAVQRDGSRDLIIESMEIT